MKPLQKNYTTLEQSKKLLKLGVPADTADCYTSDVLKVALIGDCTGFNKAYEAIKKFHHVEVSPIWSVGRLMEIFEICSGQVWQNEIIENYSKVDMLLEDFEDVEKKYTFDFLKLKE